MISHWKAKVVLCVIKVYLVNGFVYVVVALSRLN